MNVYKIRDKKTGLFSTGGAYMRWHTTGKEWHTLGHLRAHLTMVKDDLETLRKYNAQNGPFHGPYTTAEIVTYELVEASKEDIPKL